MEDCADAANAGANAASGMGDLFVARAGNALFEVEETRGGEDRVGVRIDKAGEDNLAGAVDFFGVLSELVFGEFVGGSNGGDFAVGDQDCAVVNDADFAKRRGAPRGVVAAQGEELGGVGEEVAGVS